MTIPQAFRLTRGEPSFRWAWPWRTTASQRQALLRLIAVATEERLPLAPLLEAWAADERGVQSRRLTRLARLLKDGVPLADAVEQVPGVLRDEDVLAVRFGAQSGTLAITIRDALELRQSPSSHYVGLFRKTLVYVGAVVLVLVLIVTFLQVKITPVYRQLLEEYSLEETPSLRRAIDLSDAVSAFWPLPALAILFIAWLTFTARGRRLRNAIAGRLLGPYRQLQAADLLQKLSLASRTGRPVAGALSTLARYHFDPALRHKLLFIRNEVEQGVDLWQSMTTAGLLVPAEANLLKTADRVGNRAWALQQVAAVRRRRTTRHLERLSELLLPAAILLIGSFVLFQALAYFTPLVNFIQSLA